jgi:uroporphyrinogen decarboxylase
MNEKTTTRKPLLDVLGGRKPARRPVWLMRQAGRYLPEYRETRAKAGSFLDLCYSPKLAAEVTLQPLRRFDLDAAILFSDILVVPQAMGLELRFVENEGPQLETVANREAVSKLVVKGAEAELGKIYETVSKVRALLPKDVALIGFCGGAWTVASYMVEGGGSNRKRALAACKERWFADLLQKVVEVSIGYLSKQIEAGAEALQIFDSWAGDVPDELRQQVVLEPARQMISGVRQQHGNIPVILFARGLGDGHGAAARYCGPEGLGIEQGVSLGALAAELGGAVAVQGNLEPEALIAGDAEFKIAVTRVLRDAPQTGHIFNLGHGILPQVAPARVSELVALIRDYDSAGYADV